MLSRCVSAEEEKREAVSGKGTFWAEGRGLSETVRNPMVTICRFMSTYLAFPNT